jgi:hypothetical protein
MTKGVGATDERETSGGKNTNPTNFWKGGKYFYLSFVKYSMLNIYTGSLPIGTYIYRFKASTQSTYNYAYIQAH